MNKTARRGVALGAGAAGGLALAGLLLPQIASTLNPTTLGSALLAIALALLTTAVQRLVERYNQRRALGSALRAWPPQRLGAADLATLGVYPARGATGEPPSYRPRARDEDVRLRDALGRSRVLVVHGSPRAGKSRAASEAARGALAEVPAIVPLDAPALRSLADGSLSLNLPGTRICLWLDGLDRFMEALDPGTLGSLDGIAREVRIVATIRTEQWDDLLQGTGSQSEAARALAGSAQVIELGPLGFETEEPGHDVAPSRPAPPMVLGPRAVWLDPWLGALVAGLLATLAVIGFGLAGALFKPRPIDEQMDQIKRAVLGIGGRRHVVIDARVRFHSTEADSWVLVVEDRASHDAFYAAAANGVGRPPRSDELRIYDVRDGQLQLTLDFRPKGTGALAAEWRALTAGVQLAEDYDDDGANEVIAGYAIPAQATEALVPFAIDWENGSYQLTSLTPDKPQLSARGLDRAAIGFRREAYEQPTRFVNAVRGRFGGLVVAGYRIQTFAVVLQPRSRLLSGYFIKLPQFAKPKVLELHASQIRTGSPALVPCTPTNYACRAPEREQDVIVPPDRGLDGALLDAWSAVGAKWVGQIRVIERR